jgi:hypothetical protein
VPCRLAVATASDNTKYAQRKSDETTRTDTRNV